VKPDIVTLATVGNPHARTWTLAVECDRSAGLLPAWVGAVLVSVHDDGTAQLLFVERQRWVAAKMDERIGRN
jgi:hypothetical protein